MHSWEECLAVIDIFLLQRHILIECFALSEFSRTSDSESVADMAPQDAQTPIINTYLPTSLTTHLPKTRDDDSWGDAVRSHYNSEENNDKLPTNIEALEAERERRKQDYAQIAHE